MVINITDRETALIRALRAIVAETMDYPPVRPTDGDSYLPPELVAQAQSALATYNLQLWSNPAMMACGVPA